MPLRKATPSHADETLSLKEEQAKINEVRMLITPLSDKLPYFCTDASISRFLRARNWNTEKASKMLKEALKWRLEYKPDAIRWEDIAREAETGKIYRTEYHDKYGRTVLVMRPGFQNTSSVKGQIKYLVYCMENALLNLATDQEQMVWLIDFQGWTMGSVSVKATRETAHVLQDFYPERLALGILYNPPKIFEAFWKIVKPFLEHKTYKKVKFVYSDDIESQKVITDIFDMDKVESSFGGRNPSGFDFNHYAELMKEDDKKMSVFVSSGPSASIKSQEPPLDSIHQRSESSISEAQSEEALSESSHSGNELIEKLSCKTNVATETEHKPDVIQIGESI